MHGRIVGRDDHQSALHAGDGGIDEGIGTDIHAHMLHAHQGALPGIGHAQSRLHGRFLVRTPPAAHAPFPGERIVLDEFRNLGGRRPRIGIHAGQPGIQCPQGNRLVPEQQSFHCHVRFIQSDKYNDSPAKIRRKQPFHDGFRSLHHGFRSSHPHFLQPSAPAPCSPTPPTRNS